MATRDPRAGSDSGGSTSSENPVNAERRFGGGLVTLRWQSPSGELASARAEVHDVTTGGIVVRLPEPITVGQTVRLLDDRSERSAAVMHCEKQREGFLAVLHFLAHNRRRQDRLAARGNGTLHWADGGGQRMASVAIRNVTDSGVQIEIDKCLPLLQLVRLSGETWECQGRVLYCNRQEGTNYVAGIEWTRPPYPKNSADYSG